MRLTERHKKACEKKTPYLTKDEAKRAKHTLRKTNGRRVSIYQCPYCQCWHFTSFVAVD